MSVICLILLYNFHSKAPSFLLVCILNFIIFFPTSQLNEKGVIHLLETDFSHTLKDSMELYLQQQNSIPVFLSSVTMDLFSKQTINFG